MIPCLPPAIHIPGSLRRIDQHQKIIKQIGKGRKGGIIGIEIEMRPVRDKGYMPEVVGKGIIKIILHHKPPRHISLSSYEKDQKEPRKEKGYDKEKLQPADPCSLCHAVPPSWYSFSVLTLHTLDLSDIPFTISFTASKEVHME